MNIKCIGWISSLAGNREMNIPVENPNQLKNILPFSLEGKDSIIIIVNDQPGSPESVVSNEDHVVLLPVISGG